MDIVFALLKLGMVALIAGVGAYFGSYLKKKGENLATHEDIDKLVEQVRAVTTTTKEIEAKISNEVWDRQKKWEVKKEVLFEATRRLSELDDALLSLHSVIQQEQAKEIDGAVVSEAKYERTLRWRKASAAFDETRLLISIVCGNETAEAFDAVGTLATVIAAKITQGDWNFYSNSQKTLAKLLLGAGQAVRKELKT